MLKIDPLVIFNIEFIGTLLLCACIAIQAIAHNAVTTNPYCNVGCYDIRQHCFIGTYITQEISTTCRLHIGFS